MQPRGTTKGTKVTKDMKDVRGSPAPQAEGSAGPVLAWCPRQPLSLGNDLRFEHAT